MRHPTPFWGHYGRRGQRLVVVAGLFALVACGGSDDSSPGMGGFPRGNRPGGGPGRANEEEQAVSVKAFRAHKRDISTYIISNTTLESIRKVTVFAKLDALVNRILVEEGSRVQQNEVLAELDDVEIRNEHLQARIAVDQSELSQQQAEVRAQQSAANDARAKSLFEQELISQEELDQAVLTSRTDDLASMVAKQQWESAKARLEAAEIQLAYTKIRSPISGVVTERLIEVGDRVNLNHEVFSVEDFSPLWARIFVPERNLPELKLGQLARLKVETFPNHDFQGVIKMINPTVDPDSGTIKVTLEITRGLNLLRPGMFGTSHIATETHAGAVVIPKKAVLRERDENRVFVVRKDETAEKRVVKLGFAEEEWVEILEGVAEGDAVVTVGYEGLDSDYAVSILGWDGEPQESVMASASPEPPDSVPQAGQSSQAARPNAAAADRGQRQRRAGGGPRGGFDPERMMQFLMRNPEAKKEYDTRVEKDPELATNPEKRRALIMELLMKFRGQRGRQ